MINHVWTWRRITSTSLRNFKKGADEMYGEGEPRKLNEALCDSCGNEDDHMISSYGISGTHHLCRGCKQRLVDFRPDAADKGAIWCLEKLNQLDAVYDGEHLYNEEVVEGLVLKAYEMGKEHGKKLCAVDALIHMGEAV